MPYAAVNGLELYYEIHGDGPPLLLLHGGAGAIPERWIPLFSTEFRVIAPEQMGHGRTGDLPERPFHYHDMAEDTVNLMRELGIASAASAAEPSFTDDDLRSIQAPTLVVIGDRDIVTPEHAVEMFRAIPDARLCVVPNAGHGVMPEATVMEFLRQAD